MCSSIVARLTAVRQMGEPFVREAEGRLCNLIVRGIVEEIHIRASGCRARAKVEGRSNYRVFCPSASSIAQAPEEVIKALEHARYEAAHGEDPHACVGEGVRALNVPNDVAVGRMQERV